MKDTATPKFRQRRRIAIILVAAGFLIALAAGLTSRFFPTEVTTLLIGNARLLDMAAMTAVMFVGMGLGIYTEQKAHSRCNTTAS